MSSTSLPLWATALVAALFGSLVGSFLNVVVYRVPRGLSVLAPGSFCPACRRPLAWWENVPVAGWLALRGRCRTCRAPIAARYPLVEAGNALVWAGIAAAAQGRQPTLPLCLLASTVLAIWLIEVDGHRAPRSVGALGTAGAVVAAAIARAVTGHGPFLAVALGAFAGTAAFLVLVAADRSASRWNLQGRTALVPAGSFLGALPLIGAVTGGAVVVAGAAVAVMINARASRVPAAGGDHADGDPTQASGEPVGSPPVECAGACSACSGAGTCDTAAPAARRFLIPWPLAASACVGAAVALAVAATVPSGSWP
ncbi:MAG: prepilin peptidase [Actinomycetota bacterium]|nr:prepilin peptidase [Actinomycetota bacterium]